MGGGGEYLQDADVLESGEVALGDACEVIPIQLPAKDRHANMYQLFIHTLPPNMLRLKT